MSPGPTIDARCLVTREHPPKCTATAPHRPCPSRAVPCCLRRTAARTDGHDDPLGFGNMRMCSPLTLVALTRGVVPIAKVHLLRNMVHLRCMHQPCRCSHVQPKKVDNMTCESSGCESRWYKNRKSSGWKYLPATAHTAMRTHAMFCTLPLPSTGGDTAIVIATHRLGYW